MRLHVHPQGLGDLEMRISVRDGGVQAAFWSPNDQARELLALTRHVLEAQLGRSQLRLDGFTVGQGYERRGGEPWREPAGRRELPGGGQAVVGTGLAARVEPSVAPAVRPGGRGLSVHV